MHLTCGWRRFVAPDPIVHLSLICDCLHHVHPHVVIPSIYGNHPALRWRSFRVVYKFSVRFRMVCIRIISLRQTQTLTRYTVLNLCSKTHDNREREEVGSLQIDLYLTLSIKLHYNVFESHFITASPRNHRIAFQLCLTKIP